MKIARKSILNVAILFLLLAGFRQTMQAQMAPQARIAETVSTKNLRQDMNGIASDYTEGRFTGSRGFMRAANFVVAQLKTAGLKPGWTLKNGRTTFLQPVPFIRDNYGMTTSLSISKDGSWHRYFHSADNFVVIHAGPSSEAHRQTPVFIGYGIEEPAEGWDDFAGSKPGGLDLAGRWVIMLSGEPKAEQKDSENHPFSVILRKKYADPGTADSLKYQALLRHKVAGVILLPDQYISENWETTVIRQYRFGYMHYAGGEEHSGHKEPAEDQERSGGEGSAGSGNVKPRATDRLIPYILISPRLARTLLKGESYNPFDTIPGGGKYHPYVLGKTQLAMALHCKRESIYSYNVIASSPGKDTLFKNQSIIVGAHLDHIGRIGKHIYNGANDDASGCVAVLEAARAIAAHPCKRPVWFVFYTAEELNLLGSGHFINHLPVPADRIFMNINLEQVGSRHRSFAGIWAIGDSAFKKAFYHSADVFTAPELKYDSIATWLGELSNTDSYHFISRKIPSLFLSSGGFDEHHTILDKIDLIDFEHLRKTSLLLNSLVEELGN